MQAPRELRKVHPLGKAPIVGLTLPDPADPTKKKELVLAESGVITQYLTEHFSQGKSLLPKRYHDGQEGQPGGETDEWLRYQYYLQYPEGSLMPPLLVGLILLSKSASVLVGIQVEARVCLVLTEVHPPVLKSPKIPFFLRPLTSSIVDKMFAAFLIPELDNHLAFLESQLATVPGNGNYLCGTHLTAADILMSFPLQLVRDRGAEISDAKGRKKLADKYPKVFAYLKRLEEEPGYKRAAVKIEELEKKK
jgi:glutathione S-transferase